MILTVKHAKCIRTFWNLQNQNIKITRCYISFSGSDVYDIEEKGDYYKACISIVEEADEEMMHQDLSFRWRSSNKKLGWRMQCCSQ